MTRRWMTAAMCGLAMAATCLTGCQVHVGGQVLPSPHYLEDDVQYFAPGPEAKLSREAAAMKAYRSDQALQGRGT
jgi:hypothetical protein